MLKKYRINRKREFDNQVFKSWYLKCEIQGELNVSYVSKQKKSRKI